MDRQQEAFGAFVVNLSSASALTCLLYDILITTDEEVQLIWPKPWSYTKCLYFFLRYFPVAVEITLTAGYLPVPAIPSPNPPFSPHACHIWTVYQPIAIFLLTIAVDALLLLRVTSIYRYSSPFFISFLVLCFAAEVVAMSISLGMTVPHIRSDDVCLVTFIPNALIIYGIATIAFQTLLLILTLVPFFGSLIQRYRYRCRWPRSETPSQALATETPGIIMLLVRDGTWGFCLIFMVIVGQAGLLWLQNHAMSGILFGWILSVYSFVGYRILLNLLHSAPAHEGQTELETGAGTLHIANTQDQGHIALVGQDEDIADPR